MPPSTKRQRQKERARAARAAQAEQARREQRRRTWMSIGGITVLVVVLALVFSFLGGDDDSDRSSDSDVTPTDETTGSDETTDDEDAAGEPVECPAEDGSSSRRIDFPAPPPDCLVAGATYEAVFDTTEGEIRVALDTEDTPQTTNNFVFLARYGYYDGTDLFRSNTGIDIIQGGSPHTNTNSDPGPGYTIPDEGDSWTYQPGDLVMARTAAPNSASAQFFFSTGPETAALDGQGTYVVFGHVTEGMDALEAMMANHVDSGQPGEGAPDPVPVVNKVTIIQS